VTCQHPSPPWLEFNVSRLAVRYAGNGSKQIVDVCPTCRTQTGPLPHFAVLRTGVVIERLEVIADYRGGLGRCARRGCEQEAVEDHHFAPRAIFREEAEEWPKALLCVEHHAEWHRRMGAA
jgi:hypothetical protein